MLLRLLKHRYVNTFYQSSGKYHANFHHLANNITIHNFYIVQFSENALVIKILHVPFPNNFLSIYKEFLFLWVAVAVSSVSFILYFRIEHEHG